jgi:uncharacterized membrane protein
LVELGRENRHKKGIIEAYIYRRLTERLSQVTSAIDYCESTDRETFNVLDFINLFWHNAGLRRSIDKVYEITVYALFATLVEALEVFVTISVNDEKKQILAEFVDFAEMVIGLSKEQRTLVLPAKFIVLG